MGVVWSVAAAEVSARRPHLRITGRWSGATAPAGRGPDVVVSLSGGARMSGVRDGVEVARGLLEPHRDPLWRKT